MSEITLMPGVDISTSGLDAATRKMELIANNVANAQTTRGPDGKVFQRKEAVFGQKLNSAMGDGELGGVEIREVVTDTSPGRRIYRPGHPDANDEGFLEMPNVNSVAEMVDMMSASRAFEANLSAMKTSRTMASKALGILSGK